MMFFDLNQNRRPRRRQNQTPDFMEFSDSGIFKALTVGALLYIGAKAFNSLTED